MSQKITSNRQDQIGMNLYSRIYSMAYAQESNLEYVHTPFSDRYREFEDFFNLGLGYRDTSTCSNALEIGLKIIPAFLARNSGDFKCVKFSPDFLAKLRYKYYSTEKNNSKKFKESEGIRVAIHIRSCNEERKKNKDNHEKLMWGIRQPPPAYIPACFRKLKNLAAGHISVHIFSNEELDLVFEDELFQDEKFSIYTHFNTDLKLVFHDLISSDILFRYGVSSFSGVCSIYNRNISVFSLPPGKRYLANPFISDGCCYMQAPISFAELPTFEDVAVESFLCNQT